MNSPLRPDFPLVWDNTMRSALVACPQKFAYEYLHHWKPRKPSIDLHAGKAWAEAMEVMRTAFYVHGATPEDAAAAGLKALMLTYGNFECPPDSPKSLTRLMDAFAYYTQHFPLRLDAAQPYVGPTGPMIEFSFAEVLDDGLLHPVTKDPIIYAGRADMVAWYAGACTIYDDKTTKQLGPLWAQQWDLRAQFTGYAWAAQKFGIPAAQVLVRGICILKNEIKHAHSISSRDEWRIATWHKQVVRDIRRAMQLWEEGYWDRNESDACSAYGGCMFRSPCLSRNPQPYLETAFVQRRWDPVTRTEELLDGQTI